MARTTAVKAAAPSPDGKEKAGAKAKTSTAAKPAAKDKPASTEGAQTGAPGSGSLSSGDQKDDSAASGLPGSDGAQTTNTGPAGDAAAGDGAAPGSAPGEGGQSLGTSLDTGDGKALESGTATGEGTAPGDAPGDGDAAGKSEELASLEQATISDVQGETWTLPALADFPAVLRLTNAWPGKRHIVGTDETLAPGETRAIEFTEKAYTKFSRHIQQHASLHAWKHGEGLLIEQGAEDGED